MSTFFLMGKYSEESLRLASAPRTKKAVRIIESFEGSVRDIYALLGSFDLVLIADFPNVEQAMKASMALNKNTGIAFTTSPAVTVEEFDRMLEENP